LIFIGEHAHFAPPISLEVVAKLDYRLHAALTSGAFSTKLLVGREMNSLNKGITVATISESLGTVETLYGLSRSLFSVLDVFMWGTSSGSDEV